MAKDPAFRDEASLMQGLSGGLARYKQQQKIHFVDELPKNTMGKVQKVLLRQRFADDFAAEMPVDGLK